MPDSFFCTSALWYANKGYSVIPVRDDKKPYIKWQEYQTKKADKRQIEYWWGKWPGANIGLVTGQINNLTVIDVDSDAGRDAIEEITPDNFLTPTARTPSGGEHRYCKYDERVRNAVQFLKDCDVRSEGGYIIAPPSKNGRGEYVWVEGLHINEIAINKLPYSYLNTILSYIERGGGDNRWQQKTTKDNIFTKGTRDDDLFHLANYLVKGGMPPQEIEQYLTFIASRCNPPFPKEEIYTKIQSALDRSTRKEKGMTETVRDIITQQKGIITTTDFIRETTIDNTMEEKKKLRVVIGRMVEEGLLVRTGRRASEYRIIDKNVKKADWKNALVESIEFQLPLGLHHGIRIAPSSIICFAGESNAGKTAFAMEICRNNCHKTVKYFSSEIRQEAFKERAAAHSPLEEWNVDLFEDWHPDELQDLIDPEGISVVDYLEPPGGDYTQMAVKMSELQNKLSGGVCVVCIQKKSEGIGAGGEYMKNKPTLFCTLDIVQHPVCKLFIIKCKTPRRGYRNPGGMSIQYEIGKNGVDVKGFGDLKFVKY